MNTQKFEKILIRVEQLSESNKDYVLGLLEGVKFKRLQEEKHSNHTPAS